MMRVRALELVVDRLAEVVEQPARAGDLDVRADLGGDRGGEPRRLDARAAAGSGRRSSGSAAAQRLAGPPGAARCTSASMTRLLAGLLDDAGRPRSGRARRPPRCGWAGCGRPGSSGSAPRGRSRVARGRSRRRVTTSGVSSMMRSQPVAASKARMLRPSRPMMRPLMSSRGDRDDRDRRLRRDLRGHALHHRGEHLASAGVGLGLGGGLHHAHAACCLVTQLGVEVGEQLVSRLRAGQARDAFELVAARPRPVRRSPRSTRSMCFSRSRSDCSVRSTDSTRRSKASSRCSRRRSRRDASRR